jgi:hypothetical protein
VGDGVIDWLMLRMTICTDRGNVIGPGLIARSYAISLFGRDYDSLLKNGVLVEMTEHDLRQRMDPPPVAHG